MNEMMLILLSKESIFRANRLIMTLVNAIIKQYGSIIRRTHSVRVILMNFYLVNFCNLKKSHFHHVCDV